MDTKQFIAGQRKAIDRVMVFFLAVVAIIWGQAALDVVFNLGWDTDREVLWGVPLMVAFAVLVRRLCMAVLGFVERNH